MRKKEGRIARAESNLNIMEGFPEKKDFSRVLKDE